MKMQIKTMNYHYIPIRMAKMWNTDNIKCQEYRARENINSLQVGMQNGTATLTDSFAISYKTKHTLTIRSSSCTPWYLSKGAGNISPHKNLHMDISALDIITTTWMKPRYLSVGERMKNLWYIQNGILSALKNNELSDRGNINVYY